MHQKDDSPWEATSVQNLFRYRPSGTYFARFKVGGKPIRQSLETTVFSVAKQRLPDKMREHRTLASAPTYACGSLQNPTKRLLNFWPTWDSKSRDNRKSSKM